jgi:hypothetical protein
VLNDVAIATHVEAKDISKAKQVFGEPRSNSPFNNIRFDA